MNLSRVINIVLIFIISTQFYLNIYIIFKIKKEKPIKIKNEEEFFNNKHISVIGKEILNSNEEKLIFILSSGCQACKEILDSFKFFNSNILNNIIIINAISESEKNNTIDTSGIKAYEIQEKYIIDDLNISTFPYVILIKNNKIIKSSNIFKHSLIEYISNIGEINNG